MKKLAAAFLLLLVSLNSFADTAFTSLEDVFAFVSTYYIEPRPEAIHASFDYLVSSSYPIASSAMMMQFYAVVLKEDDVLLETIVGGLARTPSVEEKIFILHILAEMGTPDSVTYLDRAREEWQDGKVQAALIHIDETRPVGLFQQEPENSDALDRLWGYFWATGDERAVVAIASVLYLWEQGRGAPAAVGGAAKWSLTHYGVRHPKVLKILTKERDRASDVKKRLLQEIITEVEELKKDINAK